MRNKLVLFIAVLCVVGLSLLMTAHVAIAQTGSTTNSTGTSSTTNTTTTSTPGVPSTGVGDTASNLTLLISSGAIALIGAGYLVTRRAYR